MLKITASAGGLGTSGSALRIKGAQTNVPVLDPYAAFVAAMRTAAPTASGLYTAQDYTTSLTQAGRLVDAFGGPLTYDAPNVQASPERAVDPATGLMFLRSDGADDTVIGSAAQTVAVFTALVRSPQVTWYNYGGWLANGSGARIGGFPALGGTGIWPDPQPRGVRRNGVELASAPNAGEPNNNYPLAPITAWMVVTVRALIQPAQTLQLFTLDGSNYFNRLHLAALLLWSTDPSAGEVQAAEQRLASYYAPLLATNP